MQNYQNKHHTKTHDADAASYRLLAAFMLAFLFYLTAPQPAYAGVLCTVAQYTQTHFARGLATIGILAVGITAMTGKMHWQMALTVAAGIAVISGAGTITAMLATGHGCAASGINPYVM